MSVQDQIRETVESNDVVLYMKGTPEFPQCGFSGRAIQILQSVGADFHTVNVLADDAVREGIKQFSNWPTIPQLYVHGQFIGGSDIMTELYEKGDLAGLIQEKASA